uniref:snRNA-activating protein complex subunit 4 n=1 Tax=Caenorhabditis japonica TaxID=281687 RepID=A0A8R1HYX3_CAEJA
MDEGECSSSSAAPPPEQEQPPISTVPEEEQALPCTTIDELLIFNETYFEIIDQSIAFVDQQLADNRRKQKQLQEEQKMYKRADVTKRKVPVHLYMPPYFKDENGMCPPMSAEAREKQELKWFDPLMKEEKKWTPSEIKTLREAVKEAMIAQQMQPLCSRRDIVVSKLKNQDATTSSWERRQWTMELEDLMRKIAYIKSKSIEEVLTVSADYSVVPWNEIANVDFKGTRTEWAVKSKWMNELNPKWNKSAWSPEEIEQLRTLRESPQFTSWPMLALKLNTNRTAYQCMEKYKTEVAQHSREWTQEEDTKLIALTKLTAINGHIQWDKVAQFMPGRTRQQVRTRFSHTLDSKVKHGRWTDQEDMLLMCAVSRHGAKDWAKVAQAVQNRNDSQCRERWMNVLNRSANVSERFTLAEDEQLLYAVKVFGKGNWAKCQSLLPKKTARQLRRRYVQLIAAKLRMIAGFTTSVDAMKAGRRAPQEDELKEEDERDSAMIPNELMIETYQKLAREKPDINETPEEFYKRINELEKPVASRLRVLKARDDYDEIMEHINAIVEKHQRGDDGHEINEELAASSVLASVNITEVDIRYMIERSHTMSRCYRNRQNGRCVDQIGCRIRPIGINMDPSLMPVFDKDTPEEEKVMRLVESLCCSVRKHDIIGWGKRFWIEYRHVGARHAKAYAENMIRKKSAHLADWSMLALADTPRPTKITLPPTAASHNFLTMLQKARTGLNLLAAEHFYPTDVPLEKQPGFGNEQRETLDGKRRMNITLASEVQTSTQFNLFYARMRTILLEPMRLQFARETAAEEHDRLNREIDLEARQSEEEAVADGVIRRPLMKQEHGIPTVTPTLICHMLSDGIKIDTSDVLANLDKNTVARLTRKKRIEDTLEEVAKRPRSTSNSHFSIDTDDIDDNK